MSKELTEIKAGLEKIKTELGRISGMVAGMIAECGSGESGRSVKPGRGRKKAEGEIPGKTIAWMAQRGLLSVDGRLTEKQKKDIVSMVVKLRKTNNTPYRVIAEFLEGHNVPTFSGVGAWHAQTVGNIMKFNAGVILTNR